MMQPKFSESKGEIQGNTPAPPAQHFGPARLFIKKTLYANFTGKTKIKRRQTIFRLPPGINKLQITELCG
jgi:hypothetical protein